MKIVNIMFSEGVLDNDEPGAELLLVLEGKRPDIPIEQFVKGVAAALLMATLTVDSIEHPSQADGYDEEN